MIQIIIVLMMTIVITMMVMTIVIAMMMMTIVITMMMRTIVITMMMMMTIVITMMMMTIVITMMMRTTLIICLFGFLMSSSATRLSRGPLVILRGATWDFIAIKKPGTIKNNLHSCRVITRFFPDESLDQANRIYIL